MGKNSFTGKRFIKNNKSKHSSDNNSTEDMLNLINSEDSTSLSVSKYMMGQPNMMVQQNMMGQQNMTEQLNMMDVDNSLVNMIVPLNNNKNMYDTNQSSMGNQMFLGNQSSMDNQSYMGNQMFLGKQPPMGNQVPMGNQMFSPMNNIESLKNLAKLSF